MDVSVAVLCPRGGCFSQRFFECGNPAYSGEALVPLGGLVARIEKNFRPGIIL